MNWQDIGALSSVVFVCIAAATVYLRLFVRNEISGSREELVRELHSSFLLRELAELRFTGLEGRLRDVEHDVRHLQEQ